MLRFLIMITFFCILVIGIDFYVQNIASPVTYVPGRIPVEPEKPNDEKEEKTEPEAKSIVEKEPNKLPYLDCNLLKTEIEFYDYSNTKQNVFFYDM